MLGTIKKNWKLILSKMLSVFLLALFFYCIYGFLTGSITLQPILPITFDRLEYSNTIGSPIGGMSCYGECETEYLFTRCSGKSGYADYEGDYCSLGPNKVNYCISKCTRLCIGKYSYDEESFCFAKGRASLFKSHSILVLSSVVVSIFIHLILWGINLIIKKTKQTKS